MLSLLLLYSSQNPSPQKSVTHIYDASSSLSLPNLETSSQTFPGICLLGDSAPWQGDGINRHIQNQGKPVGFFSLPSSDLRLG